LDAHHRVQPWKGFVALSPAFQCRDRAVTMGAAAVITDTAAMDTAADTMPPSGAWSNRCP
jgi:hypothetical protein